MDKSTCFAVCLAIALIVVIGLIFGSLNQRNKSIAAETAACQQAGGQYVWIEGSQYCLAAPKGYKHG